MEDKARAKRNVGKRKQETCVGETLPEPLVRENDAGIAEDDVLRYERDGHLDGVLSTSRRKGGQGGENHDVPLYPETLRYGRLGGYARGTKGVVGHRRYSSRSA